MAIDDAEWSFKQVKLQKQPTLIANVVHDACSEVFTSDISYERCMFLVNKNNYEHFPHLFLANLDELISKVGSK